MIIYTPVPPEIIWNEEEKKAVEYREGLIAGIPVQLKIVDGQSPVIEKIISSDPAHFLNTACQPGRVIMSDCTK
jgi:hypothetical protein